MRAWLWRAPRYLPLALLCLTVRALGVESRKRQKEKSRNAQGERREESSVPAGSKLRQEDRRSLQRRAQMRRRRRRGSASQKEGLQTPGCKEHIWGAGKKRRGTRVHRRGIRRLVRCVLCHHLPGGADVHR